MGWSGLFLDNPNSSEGGGLDAAGGCRPIPSSHQSLIEYPYQKEVNMGKGGSND